MYGSEGRLLACPGAGGKTSGDVGVCCPRHVGPIGVEAQLER
jgi:hypothetical protein